MKSILIYPDWQRKIIFQRMFDFRVVFYFVMDMCGILLKLSEFFIELFFLIFK